MQICAFLKFPLNFSGFGLRFYNCAFLSSLIFSFRDLILVLPFSPLAWGYIFWCSLPSGFSPERYSLAPVGRPRIDWAQTLVEIFCNFTQVSRPRMLELVSDKQRYHFLIERLCRQTALFSEYSFSINASLLKTIWPCACVRFLWSLIVTSLTSKRPHDQRHEKPTI